MEIELRLSELVFQRDGIALIGNVGADPGTEETGQIRKRRACSYHEHRGLPGQAADHEHARASYIRLLCRAAT